MSDFKRLGEVLAEEIRQKMLEERLGERIRMRFPPYPVSEKRPIPVYEDTEVEVSKGSIAVQWKTAHYAPNQAWARAGRTTLMLVNAPVIPYPGDVPPDAERRWQGHVEISHRVVLQAEHLGTDLEEAKRALHAAYVAWLDSAVADREMLSGGVVR